MINKLATAVSKRNKCKCTCATDVEKKKTEKLRPFPAKKRDLF